MPPTDLSIARRVDSACDRFEAAWQAGKKPRIEDFLGTATGPDRADMLKALIAVDIEVRRAAGEDVKPAPYRLRFADDADAVASAFSEPRRTRAAGETSVSRESLKTSAFEARTDTATPSATDVPKQIGRFTVTGVLGAGAFGRVYRAKDPQLGRDVAIKVPLPSAIATAADRERFLREARAAAGLHHPNICPVHEVGEENGHPFIVMGYVPGQTLAATLKARKEPLAAKQASLIARKLALALDVAHKKGVVHRDLKPANVMFDKERRDVVVTDFGLARAPRLDDAQTTRDGVLMGTPAYMSPEQARGDTKAVGPASDQYALGVMLFEMLTGRRPFTGTVTEVLGKILHVEPESPRTLRPDLDPGLAAVCLKAMAKVPAARYGSMKEFAEALQGFASDSPARPAGVPATASAETAKGATETQRIADVFAFTEQAVEKAIRKHRTPTWMKVGIGFLILIGLVVPGIVFFARTPTAKVTIQIDVDIHDKSLAFVLDGKPIEGEALTREIELKVGKHMLEVKRNGQVIRRYEFTVSKDAGPRIELKEDVPPPPPPPGDGWTPLFNGKDFTNWQTEDGSPVKRGWVIRGDAIVRAKAAAKSPNITETMRESIWTTKRFSDYILELEFQTDGNSGVHVWTDDPKNFSQTSIEVQIDAPDNKLDKNSVGAFYGLRAPSKQNVRAGEWNTARITAKGGKLTVAINGETVNEMDLDDWNETGKNPDQTPNNYKSELKKLRRVGHIGLQAHNGQISFRNVRIKELAPADDLSRWQGKWRCVGEKSKAKVWTPEEVKAAGKIMEVKNDRLVIERTIDGKFGTYTGTFKLNPSATPKEFDWEGITTPGGQKTQLSGVYEFDGKRLRFIYRRSPPVVAPPERAGWNEIAQPGVIWVEFERADESETGFVPLFNGNDLTGWSTLNVSNTKDKSRSVWKADSTREVLIAQAGDFQELQSDRLFKNFTLRFDWRFTPGGSVGANGSGIVVRSIGLNSTGPLAEFDPHGVEIDLRDKANQSVDKGMGTGCFVAYGTKLTNHKWKTEDKARHLGWLKEPTTRYDGEWNSCEVSCQGDRIKVSMNGELVNEGWEADERFGRIVLRSQNTAVEFRNVRIKKLPAPAEQGFVPLFNGKDLSGWKAVGEPKWSWAEGRALGSPAEDKPSGFLMTDADYEDFELKLQFRLSAGAGSGLFLRTDPNMPSGAGQQLEVQLVDDDHFPTLVEINKIGSVYNVFPRKVVPPVKKGDWNALRVRLEKRKIQVWINDVKTIDADLDDASRQSAHRLGLMRKTGRIGLQQNQKADVEFRDAWIKPLGEVGFVPLFNGKDLTDWKGLPGAWKLDGDDLVGHLPVEHKRNSFLWAKKPYKNFELKFQVKLHTGTGNSGVQIRSSIANEAEYRITGPQVEIDAIRGDGGLYREVEVGGGWMKQAPPDVVRNVYKPGEFNDYHVTVNGKHVKIVVNGSTLVDDDFPTMADEGLLAFQLHGGRRDDVTFRNVRIKN